MGRLAARTHVKINPSEKSRRSRWKANQARQGDSRGGTDLSLQLSSRHERGVPRQCRNRDANLKHEKQR